ncbi:hypothetical protein FB639_004445 [Coemansia asiatica]|nr:hypothetical protein FB639_004445 [Coemansia asiatica]
MTNEGPETKDNKGQKIAALQQELQQLLTELDSNSQSLVEGTAKDALQGILKTEQIVDSLESKLDDLLSRLDTMLESQEEEQ